MLAAGCFAVLWQKQRYVREKLETRSAIVSLDEVDDRRVESILSLLDTDDSIAAQNTFSAMLIGSGVVLACVLGVFFWGYLGWVQREVTHAHRKMEVAIKDEQSFADNAAHELRTPLAGMRSIIDVALYCDSQEGELRESLQDCSSIIENMELLVGKLLMLARLDGERATFHKERIDLTELIDDCWEPLREKADTRGLIFDNRVPHDLTCVSDRVGLAVIFANLLENGVEYTDENGRIRVTADKDSKGVIHAEVVNTGCRLDGSDVSMVFQKFWRGDNARSSGGRHAGLGLSLARRLARALGGDLSADVSGDGLFTAHVDWGEPSPS